MYPSFRRLLTGLTWLALLVPSAAQAQSICDGISPADNLTVESVVVASGLSATIYVTAPAGDTDRIFIAQQAGRIAVQHRGAGPTEHTVFLDIVDRVNSQASEMGLLGFVFDPHYADNGFFYVSYTEVSSGTIFSVVSRFAVTKDPDVADPTSEEILLRFPQPNQSNHNGGHILFGPDGYLYVATGDGGGLNDNHGQCGNGQLTETLLGKLLRIDPTGTSGLPLDCAESGSATIPDGNPLADGAGGDCDEIWAWGLRNPWRMAFDEVTDDLYIADVGERCWEEVNWIPGGSTGGENYGWRQMEGQRCFDPLNPTNCNSGPVACGDSPACQDPSLVDPVLVVSHSSATGGGCSVIGGFVYRGCRMPRFLGNYFYGDYCQGFVRSFMMVDGVVTTELDWSDTLGTAFGMRSFGTDAQGELYIMQAGSVFKVVPPLPTLQVSGPGVLAADQLRLSRDGAWSWEDLERSSSQPVDLYRVYRQADVGGSFECIHTTALTEWPAGGDPQLPPSGKLFAYLVTAVSGDQESSSGHPLVTLEPCGLP